MASDAYMELETRDLIGETRDETFGMESAKARSQGAFEIASFGFSATSNRQDPTDLAAKAANGKGATKTSGAPAAAGPAQTTITSVTIKKSVDASSAGLFQLCCKQELINWAVITLREQGNDRKPWLILEFTKVYLDSFQWEVTPGGGGEEAKEFETLVFSFGTILIKYNAQRTSGVHEPINIKGWNRELHQPNPIEDLGSEKWGQSS